MVCKHQFADVSSLGHRSKCIGGLIHAEGSDRWNRKSAFGKVLPDLGQRDAHRSRSLSQQPVQIQQRKRQVAQKRPHRKLHVLEVVALAQLDESTLIAKQVQALLNQLSRQ